MSFRDFPTSTEVGKSRHIHSELETTITDLPILVSCAIFVGDSSTCFGRSFRTLILLFYTTLFPIVFGLWSCPFLLTYWKRQFGKHRRTRTFVSLSYYRKHKICFLSSLSFVYFSLQETPMLYIRSSSLFPPFLLSLLLEVQMRARMPQHLGDTL